jgi:hypothetical protein
MNRQPNKGTVLTRDLFEGNIGPKGGHKGKTKRAKEKKKSNVQLQ